MNGVERRTSLRQVTSVPVRFKFLDSKLPTTHEANSHDISLGGLFINKTLEDEHLGKEINLEIDLPEISNTVKAVSGTLVRTERDLRENKVNGLGVNFTQISPEEKKKLNTFLLKPTFHPLPKIKELRPPDFRLSDKEQRNLDILDTLKRKGIISKAQISQSVDLNIVTISNYIDDFKKRGIIFEKGLDESTGGRRPSLLEINSQYGFFIGAELNLETNTIVVLLTDFVCSPLIKNKIQIQDRSSESLESLIELIFALVDESKIDRSRILAIGLGTRGLKNNYLDLKDKIESSLRLPLLIEDNAIAQIVSDVWLEEELTSKENVLYVGLDGSVSMILKGGIYRGTNNGITRMGLNQAKETDIDRDNCWMQTDCLLRQEPIPIDEKNVSRLGERFGVRLAYLINLLRPQVVVIGDIPDQVQGVFLNELKNAIKRWSFNDFAKSTRIIFSKFSEDSVARGAAALVARDVYSQI